MSLAVQFCSRTFASLPVRPPQTGYLDLQFIGVAAPSCSPPFDALPSDDLPSSFRNPPAPPPLTSATFLHALNGVKSYQSLVPRLRRLWRFGAKPLYKHKSGDVSLGSLSSFPIRIHPRAVRRELEVSAQELRSSPSPNIAVSLLPSRSQDSTYLSPGHWLLRLVPEGWTTGNWRAAACMG